MNLVFLRWGANMPHRPLEQYATFCRVPVCGDRLSVHVEGGGSAVFIVRRVMLVADGAEIGGKLVDAIVDITYGGKE